jgi:hypothetical protein
MDEFIRGLSLRFSDFLKVGARGMMLNQLTKMQLPILGSGSSGLGRYLPGNINFSMA